MATPDTTLVATVLLATVSLASGAAAGPAQSFVDRTASAGLTYVQYDENIAPLSSRRVMTGGVAAGDFDRDGWCDLVVTRIHAPPILFRNKGLDPQGAHLGFEDVTASAFNELPVADSNAIAFLDIDEDRDLDLCATQIYGARDWLWVNDGSGHFVEAASERGVAEITGNGHFGWSIATGDYDRDGFVDLYIGEWGNSTFETLQIPSHARLLQNRGSAAPGFFEDRTLAAGVSIDDVPAYGPAAQLVGVYAFAPRFADLDRDGWPELVIAGDFHTSRLFWNNGDGTFLDGTVSAGVGTDENGMGLTIGDYDGDGLFDIFVTSIFDPDAICEVSACNWDDSGNRLYKNEGGRVFSDRTDEVGVRDGGWGWGASFFDYDNDGDLDLVMTNGVRFDGSELDARFENDPMRLWRNDGAAGLREVSVAEGITDTGSGKGLVTFDYDRDGDLDIFVVNNRETPVLYENVGQTGGGWLQVALVGRASNSYGVGARIDVRAHAEAPEQAREIDGGSNFLGHGELVAHFGLGPGSAPVSRVTVNWPSGRVEVLRDVPRNRRITIVEGALSPADAASGAPGTGPTAPSPTGPGPTNPLVRRP